jgi:hypothetical protein
VGRLLAAGAQVGQLLAAGFNHLEDGQFAVEEIWK